MQYHTIKLCDGLCKLYYSNFTTPFISLAIHIIMPILALYSTLMRRLLLSFFLILKIFCLFSQGLESHGTPYLDSLLNESKTSASKKDWSKLAVLIQTAEEFINDSLPGANAYRCKILFLKGKMNLSKNELKPAEKNFLQLIEILKSQKVLDTIELANGYFQLAQTLIKLGDFNKAEEFAVHSEKYRFIALGTQHVDYALSLSLIARILENKGNYQESESFYLRAIAILEKVSEIFNAEYLNTIGNLAILYKKIGDFEKAENLFLQLIKAQSINPGKTSSVYASTVSNLANIYFNLGQYKKAESLYIESIQIREKTVGKVHLDYAASLFNLATLYYELANYKNAEPLFLESKSIREKILGKEHYLYATSLNNLANLYLEMGQYSEAESLYLEAKTIKEKVFGKTHLEYAKILGNLADVGLHTMQLEKADLLLKEAEHIFALSVGKDHIEYLKNLYNQSLVLKYKNLYSDGLNFCKEQCLIAEKSLGSNHPLYLKWIENLAWFFEQNKNYIAADSILGLAENIYESELIQASGYLSESELDHYIHSFEKISHQLLSILSKRPVSDQGKLSSIALQHFQFIKGLLLSVNIRQNELARADSTSIVWYNELKVARRKWSIHISLPAKERNNQLLLNLERQIDEIDKKLNRSLSDMKDFLPSLNSKVIQDKLKLNECLIEFVRFNLIFPDKTDSMFYGALILNSHSNYPEFIQMFEERSLDSILNYNSIRRADYANQLYSLSGRGAQILNTPNRNLKQLIYQPIQSKLKNINKVFYSSVGSLNRINIDAIPVSETEILADQFQFVSLRTTRNLINNFQRSSLTDDAVLIGGVKYFYDSTQIDGTEALTYRSKNNEPENNSISTSGRNSWQYLPYTEKEVSALQKILQSGGFKVSLSKGFDGTEEKIKEIGMDGQASPRVIHLATHGYFSEIDKQFNPKAFSNSDPSVFLSSSNPMMRSGIILANGGYAWSGNMAATAKEDGILTAYEISLLNLSNTELVVLSACETGLGDILGNEGVYGLQRAFKIAGVKYIIMSLWQVPDKQTSLLMTTFYKKWILEKMSIPDAFHAAQKELRDVGLDPYQWAGFVLVE